MGWRLKFLAAGLLAFLVAPFVIPWRSFRAPWFAPSWIALGSALALVRISDLLRGWRRARRRRLIEHGRCPVCGYDLRGSPDQCPECGTYKPLPPRIDPDRFRPYQRAR